LDLTINNATTGTDVQSTCEPFTWIDGNTYTASNNTATFTLPSSTGCDSGRYARFDHHNGECFGYSEWRIPKC
jgi:hypothetical protein